MVVLVRRVNEYLIHFMQRTGRFILVDGIDGSGKSTLIQAMKGWSEACEHRVFDLHDWTEDTPPRFEDMAEFDTYFTYEPSRTWIGRAIRYELINKDQAYGAEEIAHAFALDREIMYRRLVLPALHAGKTVIQDRGVSTSIIYQAGMDGGLPLEAILHLPGNALAMKHAPDALILTKLPAEVALSRISSREKDDQAIFEQLNLLKRFEQRFAEPWFRDLFTSHGTRVFELDMTGTEADTNLRAQQLVDHILSTC